MGSNWLSGFAPKSIVQHLGDSAQHMGNAFTGKGDFFPELYRSNWNFTQAHPGATSTKNVLGGWGIHPEDKLGTWSSAAGGIGGALGGPIVGGIVGGAAGWGGGSQFGGENDYKNAYRSAGQGAASGVVSGYASDYLSQLGSSGGGGGSTIETMGSGATPAMSSSAGSGGGSVASSGGSLSGLDASSLGLGGGSAAGGGGGGAGATAGGSAGGLGGTSWSNLLGSGLGAGLDYWKTRQQQKALEPDLNAREDALKWYKSFLSNPQAMYKKDPSLLAARNQRMADVNARQLAQTGGTRGGAYARDLMEYGSKFDRDQANMLANQYLGLLNATSPALASSVNLGGGAAGAGAGAGSNFLQNVMFQNMMDKWMSSGS